MKETTPESLREWATEIRADNPEWGYSASEIEAAAETIESLQERCEELERDKDGWKQLARQRAEPDPEMKEAQDIVRRAAKTLGNDPMWQRIEVLEAAQEKALGHLGTATNINLTPGAIRQQIGYAIEALGQALTSSKGVGDKPKHTSECAISLYGPPKCTCGAEE